MSHQLVLFNKKTNQLVLAMHLTPIQLLALLPYVTADPNDHMMTKRYELSDFALLVAGRES